MDHKYFGQVGEKNHLEIPEAVVGIVSGGIRNEEHLEVALEMRKKCQILIALGTCATHGGIPALINLFDNRELLDRYYRTTESTDPADPPDQVIPPLLDRCFALDEKIKVDLYLPGCPPHPDHIAGAIRALLKGETPQLPSKSVCDTCPTVREGKGTVKKVQRFTRNAQYQAEEPVSRMRCLLEQGWLCLGPVTRAGCAGEKGEAPRCLTARVPCQGCYGPVQQNGNQLLDMLNALASNGIDYSTLVDHKFMLSFSGAHGRLVKRPAAGSR
jgi:F420-non-reducing hydrogenase small subunit